MSKDAWVRTTPSGLPDCFGSEGGIYRKATGGDEFTDVGEHPWFYPGLANVAWCPKCGAFAYLEDDVWIVQFTDRGYFPPIDDGGLVRTLAEINAAKVDAGRKIGNG